MPFNPKSLKNIHPRSPDYEESKVKKQIMITPLGWQKLEQLSQKLGYRSRSALIEAIAREELPIGAVAEK